LNFKELFNKKKLNWSAEKDYGVNEGKVDRYSWSKIVLMIPLVLLISSVLIIAAVIGIPSFKSALTSVFGGAGGAESLRSAAPEALFSDVKADSKYFDSLAYLKKQGIIGGFADNSFRPYQELKRAELVKTIVAAKKYFPLALNYNNCFADVGMEWYAPAVCLAKEKEWVKGYADGSFHPMESLTRVEALKMIMEAFDFKLAESAEEPVTMFADLDRDAWYYSYVETALVMKLIDDNPSLEFFRPEDPALRGDTAQIIYRVLQSQL
jgi:hypothetical protein